MPLSDAEDQPPAAPTYNYTQNPGNGTTDAFGVPVAPNGVGTAAAPGYPPAPAGGYAPPTNWNGGGNSIASGQLQQATPVEQQQAQYAQQMAGYYQGQVPGALQIAAPTIGTASSAQLGAAQGQLGAAEAGYQQVAQGQGPMGQLAQNQLQAGIGQSEASNLALAHSATGPLGGAAAMRQAQQQNAQTTAGAAGASGLLAAQQQQAGLAGLAGTAGTAGQLGLSQYQTAQQQAAAQAQLTQAQTGQNEQYSQNLANTALNQQQVANQATQSLAGLGVQAGLGEAGTAVGAQNATTALIGTGSTIAAGVGQAIGGGLTAPVSDEELKQGVQAEGNSNINTADTPISRPNQAEGEGTVLSSGATTSQEAGDVGMGALKGAGRGAGIGGLIGSIVPGIGNAAGAAIGAGVGGLAGGITGGMGNRDVYGSVASDKLEKVGADDEGRGGHLSLADEFLQSLHPYSYEYKDPRLEPTAGKVRPGGRYLGVMAQDVEKAPEIGHQIVFDSPEGKRIDVGAGLSAALAGLARINERLCAVEGRK